jgi:hypothetical protein
MEESDADEDEDGRLEQPDGAHILILQQRHEVLTVSSETHPRALEGELDTQAEALGCPLAAALAAAAALQQGGAAAGKGKRATAAKTPPPAPIELAQAAQKVVIAAQLKKLGLQGAAERMAKPPAAPRAKRPAAPPPVRRLHLRSHGAEE